MTESRAASKGRVLIADDDPAIIDVLRDVLEGEGFTVMPAKDGIEALRMVYEETPDIVLLDVSMPRMDGFQVCKVIREDVLFQHLPVLMLTASKEHPSIVKGLGLGADDYVNKPFDRAELVARITSLIRRSRANLDANPLTHLPGNNTIEKIITSYLQQRKSFALLYVDLNNFKAFNDYYGFAKGDEVIRTTARIVCATAAVPSGFVAHVGGDDFIVFSPIDRAESICREIIDQFDRIAPNFYPGADRERGYIETTDRKGLKQKFGLLSIAIGVVINENDRFGSLGEISQVSAEVKKCAKNTEGSSYFIDRRNYPKRAPVTPD